MKAKLLIIFLTLFLGVTLMSYGQAMADQNDLICYKGECWQEEGVSRLAGKGCPTPTLFVKTSLGELKSYIRGAKKFGLTPEQVKKLTDIYEHANMVVVKARGQLQSATILLITEMTKKMSDQNKIDKLIDEIEKYCWETVDELAKDIHAARSIVK